VTEIIIASMVWYQAILVPRQLSRH